MTTLPWRRDARGNWVAPPETPTDTLYRVFSGAHTVLERLQAIGDWMKHAADEMGLPRRDEPPPADFQGDVWPPPETPLS